MRRIFNEPLLAFLLISGGLFFIFQQTADIVAPDRAEIVVSAGQILALTSGFEKSKRRSPTDNELNGLIRNYVREEVMYREALAMRLDEGDAIIKRRLVQKLMFLSEDLADLDSPGVEELDDYFAKHREEYRQASRYNFRQIYFNVSERGDIALVDATALLAVLQKQDSDISNLGDALMVRQQFEGEPEREIARALGADFVEALGQLPTGEWAGPIRSGFGLHLVRIDKRIKGELPKLEDVRKFVIRDWASAKRKTVNKAFYETLRQRYYVTIENAQPVITTSVPQTKENR